jgi:hypothetical protein
MLLPEERDQPVTGSPRSQILNHPNPLALTDAPGIRIGQSHIGPDHHGNALRLNINKNPNPKH